MKPAPVDDPASNVIPCKECGDLYIPFLTNKEGRPIDGEGNFTEIKCRDCRRGEERDD